jgi:glutamate carboxypeptidase
VHALAAELLQGARERRADLVDLVLSLASVDAPSGAGADALTPAADQLAAELTTLGGRLSRTPGLRGELLELELGGGREPPVLLLGHYDTVWPAGTAAARPPRLDGDGVVRGPGVFDMRAGIASAITALRLLRVDRLSGASTFLLTPDEETGSATSAGRIVELAARARCALVLEPPLPGGGLKTARSGWAVHRLRARGRAAHAGLEPERGVSAIDELCDALVRVRTFAAPEGGTTINPGLISGGTAANTVAAEAHAILDVRARTRAEQDRVDRDLRGLQATRAGAGASLEVTRLHRRAAMERTPAIAAAFEHARGLASLIGVELWDGPAGGTSDANLFADRDVAVLDGLGPDGGGAHAEDEHVLVDSLVERTALLGLLLARPPGR